MSAETVTNKIEEKAKESAREILAIAEKEGEKVRDGIISEAHEREEKIIKSAGHTAEITKKGILQSANQSARLLILKTKREAMDKVKDEAKAKLLASDGKEIVSLFLHEMKKSGLSGEYTLFPSGLHRDLIKKNVKEIEKSVGIKITVSDDNAEINNGFILSNDTYDVDFSLDAIVEEAFEISEKSVYDTLFEGE
ncbi:MAG: V-type ATP synthase subunit E [Clostridia bacterium]|nr:V-type ATP synthase subunit E [Clostridia bacterium]